MLIRKVSVFLHATFHTQDRCTTFKKIALNKIKSISLIWILILTSCKSEPKLNGNYSTCHNGLYGELYIKNDSMRMATSLGFVSGLRKYEIKNDSFHHYSFGDSEFKVAKINFMENNAFELIYPKDSVRHIFTKMNIKIDYDMNYEQFLDEFYKRKEEIDCFIESER